MRSGYGLILLLYIRPEDYDGNTAVTLHKIPNFLTACLRWWCLCINVSCNVSNESTKKWWRFATISVLLSMISDRENERQSPRKNYATFQSLLLKIVFHFISACLGVLHSNGFQVLWVFKLYEVNILNILHDSEIDYIEQFKLVFILKRVAPLQYQVPKMQCKTWKQWVVMEFKAALQHCTLTRTIWISPFHRLQRTQLHLREGGGSDF